MNFQSRVRKVLGVALLSVAVGGCGDDTEDIGEPEEPNIGPGVPAGANPLPPPSKKSAKSAWVPPPIVARPSVG